MKDGVVAEVDYREESCLYCLHIDEGEATDPWVVVVAVEDADWHCPRVRLEPSLGNGHVDGEMTQHLLLQLQDCREPVKGEGPFLEPFWGHDGCCFRHVSGHALKEGAVGLDPDPSQKDDRVSRDTDGLVVLTLTEVEEAEEGQKPNESVVTDVDPEDSAKAEQLINVHTEYYCDTSLKKCI